MGITTGKVKEVILRIIFTRVVPVICTVVIYIYIYISLKEKLESKRKIDVERA